jgi:hypothetical protein
VPLKQDTFKSDFKTIRMKDIGTKILNYDSVKEFQGFLQTDKEFGTCVIDNIVGMYGKSLKITREQFIKFCSKYYQDNISSLDLGINNDTTKAAAFVKEDIKISKIAKENNNNIRLLKAYYNDLKNACYDEKQCLEIIKNQMNIFNISDINLIINNDIQNNISSLDNGLDVKGWIEKLHTQDGIINDIYIVENSHPEYKNEALKTIKENINKQFKVHNSEFNMGQRAAMLQMFDDMNIDDYDFIQFTDQDNLFVEPISTYCNILNQFPDKYVATGYMSKEHEELGWIESKFGRLNENRACRAGHMVMRVKYIKNMMPIHLDRMHNDSYVNSSWNAGLDWELTYWNPKSPGSQGKQKFVLCVPGGVLHKGTDSTMYDWPVEENEYRLEELIELRKNKL